MVFRTPTSLLVLALLCFGCGGSGADVRINEFVAASLGGLKDVDGTVADWIEIRNHENRPVDLEGWVLLDGGGEASAWTFPAVSIPAEGYLVVFASGKNRRQPGAELHTSFKLSRGGERLALRRADGSTASGFTPAFPKQLVDTAYGFPSGSDRAAFLEPTPGKANPASGRHTIAAAPTFGTPSATFVGAVSITLVASDPGAEIRYTRDGQRPTATSPRYEGPIELRSTTRLRARSFVSGRAPSVVVSAAYIAMEASQQFESRLPIVLLHVPAASVGPTWEPMHIQVVPRGKAGRSSLRAERDFAGEGAIRVRGSTDRAKPNYAIELRDEAGADRDVALLGLPADSDWVLSGAQEVDPTLLRSAFVYELSNHLGRYAPRTQFCEVFLIHGSERVGPASYVGIYVLTEKIKRGPHRVDIESKGEAGGYLLEVEKPGAEVAGGALDGMPIRVLYPKASDFDRTWITDYLRRFEAVLRGPEFANPETGYSQFLDVESWIDHHILNEFAKNPAGLGAGTYLFKRRAGRLEMGPVWGFESAMGAKAGDDRASHEGFVAGRRQGWWGRLLEDPAFRRRYRDRWRELRSGPLSPKNLSVTMFAFLDGAEEAHGRNARRWPRFALEQRGWLGEVQNVRRWLELRATWLDRAFED